LERGPEIEYLLDAVGRLLKRSPDIADNLNRAFGDVRERVGGDTGGFDRLARTVGQLERLSESPAFGALLERMQDPETADALVRLIDRAARIDSALQALERLLARAPEIADNLNGLVRQMREQSTGKAGEAVRELGSIDPRKLVQLLNDLFVVVNSPQTRALLGSSVFLDRSVALVDQAAQSALDATADPATARQTTSVFGLLGLLKDPDVQRTLQFGISFARRFGKTLEARPRA
jgi:uncharacterized protein YjgD (DUF1641 family)